MDTAVQINDIVKDFADFFQSNQSAINEGYPGFVGNLRTQALNDFVKQGIPARKSERYKYTYLEPFFQKDYKRYIQPRNISLKVDEVFHCDVPDLNTDVILVINGFYYSNNTINGKQPNGIWIGSLLQAAKDIPQVFEKHFGKYASLDDSIISLNTACFRDGLMVYVPKNTTLEKPLQVINIKVSSDEDVFVQQRNLIVLDHNSSANIVICEHTLSPQNFFTNSVTEVYVGNNARFDQTRLQNEHNAAVMVSSEFIQQESSSVVNNSTFTLHGGMVRNNLKVILNGEGAENNSSGLFLTDKMQHVDNYVFINHAKPNCTSNQLYKGILDDVSTGSFNGRILVSRDAQKTAAYQRNNNLLLTSDARMNTRPQLEIYADDVKCSHGATVGQLNQDAMFYMQARGISKKEARMLLMFAFAHEIIQNIKVEHLKERIDDMTNRRLRGELSRCHNCNIHCC
jgi:Fe-S cluster assembly protein SufD